MADQGVSPGRQVGARARAGDDDVAQAAAASASDAAFAEVQLHVPPPRAQGKRGGIPGTSPAPGERGAVQWLTLDDALSRHVGAFGPGQALMLVAASMSWVTLACVALAMVFLTSDPVRACAWRCAAPGDAACAAAWEAAPTDPGPFCALPRGAYAFDPPRLSVVSEFGLMCAGGWKVAVGNSAYFVGIWAGSTPFGWLSDHYGRRTCLIASNLASALACLLCAAAPGYWAFVLARVAVGFFAAGLPIGAFLLATESVGPAVRGVAGLANQLIYHPGEWMLPLLSSALHDWRHLSAALAGVCLAGAAAAALVGESPRWLLSRGRAAEAERVVAWLAAWNGRPLPPGVRLVSGDADDGGGGGSGAGAAKSGREGAAAPAGVAEGGGGRGGRYAALQQEADGEPLEASPQTDLAAGGSGSGSEEGWRLLFSHPLLRRSLLVTSGLAAVSAIIFFVAGLASDALQGYSVEKAFFVTSLFEVPAYVVGAAAIDTVGRRATVFTFLLLSGLSSLGCAVLGPGAAQVALATVNRGVISAAWGASYIVAAEACITPLRSQALGLNNQAARISGVLAPAVPYLAARLRAPELSFWVMGALGVAASAAVLLLPETRGKPQADTIEQLEEIYGRGGGGGSKGGQPLRAGGGGGASADPRGRRGARAPRLDQGLPESPGDGWRCDGGDGSEEEDDVERRPLVGPPAAGGSGGRAHSLWSGAVAAAAAPFEGRTPSNQGGRSLWPSWSFSTAASGDLARSDSGRGSGGGAARGTAGGAGGGAGASRLVHQEGSWVQMGTQRTNSSRDSWVL